MVMNPQEALALMPAAFVKAKGDYSGSASLTKGKIYVSLKKETLFYGSMLQDVILTIRDDNKAYVYVSCGLFDAYR